jgi:gamma-glutamyltranspeptidase
MARSVGRWWWPILALGGFLAVTGFVLRHDDPAPGLSTRGLLTVALAAAVVALLTLHRRYGPRPLARALAEYAVVFLLAVLLATTGIDVDQAPSADKQTSTARDQRPALIKVIDGFGDWLREWRTWARKETDRRAHSSATSPAPPLPSSTRRPL